MKRTLPFFLGGILLLWFGMVAGISFLEAPLKFQAPGITIALGLGIGRLVFQALNKIEIGLCIALIVMAWFSKPDRTVWFGLAILAAILAAQTAWLLPALDARAEVVVSGGTPPPSNLHLLYIILEMGKLFFLVVSATFQFKFATQSLIKQTYGESAEFAQWAQTARNQVRY